MEPQASYGHELPIHRVTFRSNSSAAQSPEGVPSKKIKPPPPDEEPAIYSENVRKKLASTSRTGQACDRCKERKMKCDPDPVACQPCRQKHLRCFTTDRVTGQSRERGQVDRVEGEMQYMRDQLAAYQRRFGPLPLEDVPPSAFAHSADEGAERRESQVSVRTEDSVSGRITSRIPSSKYIGWPAPEHIEVLHSGPLDGTLVNLLENGTIDIADFQCDMMQDFPIEVFNYFNMSRNSVTNTLCGRQFISDLRLPSKEEAIREVNNFLVVMWHWVPIVHKPSFVDLVHRMYDEPTQVTLAERVQVVIILAILAHQTAIRNHLQAAEKLEESHRYFHYALGCFRDLERDGSLASFQAMALSLVHLRNLPKPGVTWELSHKILVRAMELNYHRDPIKVKLPPEENNALSRQLRIRVFHVLISVCVTTGCRVGRPAPWQFQHMDVPLAEAIMDDEISKRGVSRPLSGHCDFWPHLHLAKLLPLLTELYNSVVSVRRSEKDYLKTVEILRCKVEAWRADWDTCTANEKSSNVNLTVATLLMESWTAEYLLNLYHPTLCVSKNQEVLERNLEICHKSAKRLLFAFHTLSNRYKGADFTWHSTVAYALGFGVTLHAYRQRRGQMNAEQVEAARNEMNGWLSLMAYADLILRTGNHYQRVFQPLVREVEELCQEATLSTPAPAPAPPQMHSTPVQAPHQPPALAQANHSLNHRPAVKTEVSPRAGAFTPITQQAHPQAHSQAHPYPSPVGASFHPNTSPPVPQAQNWPTASMHYVQPTNMNQTPVTAYTGFNPGPSQYTHTHNGPGALSHEIPNNMFAFGTGQGGSFDMIFSAAHYTSGSPAMMWPDITGGHGHARQ